MVSADGTMTGEDQKPVFTIITKSAGEDQAEICDHDSYKLHRPDLCPAKSPALRTDYSETDGRENHKILEQAGSIVMVLSRVITRG